MRDIFGTRSCCRVRSYPAEAPHCSLLVETGREGQRSDEVHLRHSDIVSVAGPFTPLSIVVCVRLVSLEELHRVRDVTTQESRTTTARDVIGISAPLAGCAATHRLFKYMVEHGGTLDGRHTKWFEKWPTCSDWPSR